MYALYFLATFCVASAAVLPITLPQENAENTALPIEATYDAPHNGSIGERDFPPIVNPWYVVGLWEEDDCNFAGCTHAYGLGAMNMNAGTIQDVNLNGVGHAVTDLCGATIDGATVICQGNINAQCADPGVALYKSRTCRTYCPGFGDKQFVWNIFEGDFASSLSTVLVCDRALS